MKVKHNIEKEKGKTKQKKVPAVLAAKKKKKQQDRFKQSNISYIKGDFL